MRNDAFKARPRRISVKAFRLLFAFVLLLPLCGLHAQIEEHALMSVNIPFAFSVENTHLPAGRYIVYSELGHTWKLSSFQGGSAFFRVIPDEGLNNRPSRGKLVFHRYETEFVLHAIHPSNSKLTATLPVAKTEQELAHRRAQPELAMIYAGNTEAVSAPTGSGRK
jgi:hypothetical protein